MHTTLPSRHVRPDSFKETSYFIIVSGLFGEHVVCVYKAELMEGPTLKLTEYNVGHKPHHHHLTNS